MRTVIVSAASVLQQHLPVHHPGLHSCHPSQHPCRFTQACRTPRSPTQQVSVYLPNIPATKMRRRTPYLILVHKLVLEEKHQVGPLPTSSPNSLERAQYSPQNHAECLLVATGSEQAKTDRNFLGTCKNLPGKPK